MHHLVANADRLSRGAIGAAIEVHRITGPGLLERIYERCLMRVLDVRGVSLLSFREIKLVRGAD